MNFQISKERCMRLAVLGEPYDIAAGGVASNAVFATLYERQGEHYLRLQPHGYEFPIALPVISSALPMFRLWTLVFMMPTLSLLRQSLPRGKAALCGQFSTRQMDCALRHWSDRLHADLR